MTESYARTIWIVTREATGNVDVHRILVIHDPTNVTHGSVHKQFTLLAQLPSLFTVCVWQRARITEL